MLIYTVVTYRLGAITGITNYDFFKEPEFDLTEGLS